MTRVVVALIVFALANAGLVHAAVRQRVKVLKVGEKEKPLRIRKLKIVGEEPMVVDHESSLRVLRSGMHIGAVPTTPEGRRALLMQIHRLRRTPGAMEHVTDFYNHPEFGPALALAEVEDVATQWRRPVAWAQEHWAGLTTDGLDRDGKPFTPGEEVGFSDDDQDALAGLKLDFWAPPAGSLRH
jgi:hypothetical protein